MDSSTHKKEATCSFDYEEEVRKLLSLEHMNLSQDNFYGYEGSISSKTSTGGNNVPEGEVKTSQSQSNAVNIDISIISSNKLLEDYQNNLSLGSEIVSYVKLTEDTPEFRGIKGLFINTNRGCLSVSEIYRIENPYLYAAYLLKEEQLLQKHFRVESNLLFHGTKEINVDSICKFNFNWRLRGTSTGHKFGQGVSFSPRSYYSSHYSDTAHQKVMLVVRVLQVKSCLGDKYMQLPIDGCDTSQSATGDVVVKYDDNTFYPAYKIIYHR